jgi:uncharacterized membrane protein
MDYNNPNVPPYMPPVNPADDVTRGKTIAILSYCTLIGWIIAIIMHQSEKTRYGAFHLRQGLGLFIFAVGAMMVLGIIGLVMLFLWALLPFIQLTLLVFMILGIINAAGGKMQGLPLIGKLSDKMLAGIQ